MSQELSNMGVTGKTMDAPAEDAPAAARIAGSGKPPHRGRQKVYVWVAVAMVAVLVLLAVLDMRRVSSSSASSQKPAGSATSGAGQQQPGSTPSARIVGYWVSERRDHVMCFTPIDPALREGTYAVVSRGDTKAETVRFKVLHEETAGEQIVIRKKGSIGQRLVVKQKGAEVTYRLQSEAPEVTFNVAKDGKSMTRLEIVDGEPVITTYFNAGEADHP